MVEIQTLTKQISKIGKQSLGLIFPVNYIFIIDWFKGENYVDIETHKDENDELYIIIRQHKNE